MLGTAGNLCAIPAADWAGCIPPFKFEEDELKSQVEAHECPMKAGVFMRGLFLRVYPKMLLEQGKNT